jgi:putative intracellular protease/amidase
MTSVLMVVTGASVWSMKDGQPHPTGFWAEEFVPADATKVVAAVCHGPASFLSAQDADGAWLFKGRKPTAFSNEEETMATWGLAYVYRRLAPL